MKRKPLWLELHKLLHSIDDSVTIRGNKFSVEKSGNNLRMVKFYDSDYGALTIVEQNPGKLSPHGARARAGETLSWVIPVNAFRWHLIDEPVKQPKHATN